MAIQTSVTSGPVAAIPGMKADASASVTATKKNAEASASMPFGAIVAFKTSSPTSDDDLILPAASTAKLFGVVVYEADFARTVTLADGTVAGEQDATGLITGAIVTAARSGCYKVICEDGCVPGDRLFVRFSGGTLGAARSTDAGGSTCIDATNCGQWESTTAAGLIGTLRFDFVRKP